MPLTPFRLLFQFFSDSFIAEQKLAQLVNELNTSYEVHNMSTRLEAEKAVQSLMVSATIANNIFSLVLLWQVSRQRWEYSDRGSEFLSSSF